MRNVRRRLEILERLPQYQPPPSLREEIIRLALQTLAQEDLEYLPSTESDPTQLSEREVAAYLAWENALEVEARRMGLNSFAEAQQTKGRRA
jgi:hypothetical protein